MDNSLVQRIAERFSSLPAHHRRLVYDQAHQHGVVFSQLPILPRARGSRERLSYAQSRQWFLWQMDRKSTAYHVSYGVTLEGYLRARSTAIRIRHSGRAARVTAYCISRVERRSARADHSTTAGHPHPGCRRERASSAGQECVRAEEAARFAFDPFDLTVGPLFRVGLIRLAVDVHILVVAMHHIVSDGQSMQIIMDEFAELYRANVEGRPPQLKTLPITYADYAIWQRDWLEAGEQERQLRYWRSELHGEQPVLSLPVDHPHQAEPRHLAGHFSFELPEALTSALHRVAREHRATLFMVLLAGFQAVLYRYTGQHDVRVGTTNANRIRPETQGVVGFFVNTQILRSSIDADMQWSALIDQVRTKVVGAQEYQDLPFEQLVEDLQPERDLSQPLFQVLMDHQRKDYRGLLQLPGLTVKQYELGKQGALFELWLNTVEQSDGRVRARFSYAVERFKPATIERLGIHFLRVLQAIAEDPRQRIGALTLLGTAELQHLHQWELGDRRDDQPLPVHRVIERQSRASADAVALIFEDTQLNYAELNARANQLAHRLIRLGVKPEVRVGIAQERSMDLVVSLLAVLKAGGALRAARP